MKIFDLNEKIVFSEEKPIKRHFLNAKGFHAAIICLKKGIEIAPHPEDYDVLLTVLEGKGTFTDSNGSRLLKKNQCIYIKKNEVRGIKPEEDLVVLGIQGREKEPGETTRQKAQKTVKKFQMPQKPRQELETKKQELE